MDTLHTRAERTLSERLYRLLLRAYPRAFREEYAAEMLLTFRDAYREASREQGIARSLSLWGNCLSDFIASVCAQHAQNLMARVGMAQPGDGLALAGQGQLAWAASFMLRIGHHSDVGRVRASNEDRCLSLVPDDDDLARARGALFVVADGMGGAGRGDVAAEMVVQQVKDAYYHNLQDDLPDALRSAVQQAGAAVLRASEAEPVRGGVGAPHMGATCVAAVLHDHRLYVVNVGDSRAYVLQAQTRELRQVTRDHSLVAQLVERGELSPAEARIHPQRSLIYRALGLPDTEVDLFVEPIQEDDTLILCTDGLCSVVPDEELREVVASESPEESVQRLIARANEGGGPDNITAIVVRVSWPE